MNKEREERMKRRKMEREKRRTELAMKEAALREAERDRIRAEIEAEKQTEIDRLEKELRKPGRNWKARPEAGKVKKGSWRDSRETELEARNPGMNPSPAVRSAPTSETCRLDTERSTAQRSPL
jgi:hypothetical protein